MLKAIRQTKEKFSTGEGQDVEDKKRIKEYQDAATTLFKSLETYYKTFNDYNKHLTTVHEDIANLYPAGGKLSLAVAQLSSNVTVFKDSSKLVDELKSTLTAPTQSVIQKAKSLMELADERQVCRAEITHYRDKVAKLANEGLTKAKSQLKAESNQEKLFQNQKRFTELDKRVAEALQIIDNEIADLIHVGIGQFVQLHANYASGLLHAYGAAISAIPGAIRPGAAGSPPATTPDADTPGRSPAGSVASDTVVAPPVSTPTVTPPSTPGGGLTSARNVTATSGFGSPTAGTTPAAVVTSSPFTAAERAVIAEVPMSPSVPVVKYESRAPAPANPFGGDTDGSFSRKSSEPAPVASGLESPPADIPPPAPADVPPPAPAEPEVATEQENVETGEIGEQ